MTDSEIVIRGAREHNLQNVTLRLPKNKLIVMTGVSGSGKSSLAFDTLYAEGQRRYVESLSTYARQFLGQLPKPNVDAITGLAPSISIQQKVTSRNPRSTVGTITEIHDYLRVLFARVGLGYCYISGKPIQAQTVDQILESIALLPEGTRFQILAPIVQQQKGEFRDLFADLLKQGFLRARVDGEIVSLKDDLKLKRHFKHTIEVVVDRLVTGKAGRQRLSEAIESAIKLSGGTLIMLQEPEHSTDVKQPKQKNSNEKLYSARYACPESGMSYEPPTPQLFSFNSPLGMCLECNGLGRRHDIVLESLINDESKSISKGALHLLGPLRKVGRWRRHIYTGVAEAIEQDLDLPEETILKTPWNELPDEAKSLFLYGLGNRHITFAWRHSGGIWKHGGTWQGLVADLLDSYRKTNNPMRRRQLEKHMDFVECSSCRGQRLNAQARHVRITSASGYAANGHQKVELSLPEVCALSVAEAAEFFEHLELEPTAQYIAEEPLKEIRARLSFLLKCGLDYLTLERSAPTLSGGESQRIRLAGQIGCGLVDVVYILDEPSIGLHPRDNQMLLESLCNLRDQGNTVIVVEHDEETMLAADHIVDFGPGPGVRGGRIVAEGTVDTIRKNKASLTGKYLAGQAAIAIPQARRVRSKAAIKITGAQHNNLNEIDVEFPLGLFICVTGVSGSGKSSLVNDILWQVLNRDVNKGKGSPGTYKRISGLKQIDKAIDIDQSPIGRTPRSNPATYVKLFDHIRSLFTKLPGSKLRGYKPGRFSFNVADGRCEACEGYGATRLEMDFLADIWVRCPVCEGKRFNHETLEVRFKDKNIAEVLDLDVQEALIHFENVPQILRLLQALHDVGLDYLKLGQPSPTLSGGEAQRIKLARELGKRSTGTTFYVLDEPTTGLHFDDVKKLLTVLHGFVAAGNTVLVVEHNLDVIKTADWIIDLGPTGGLGGGTIVAEGTPEEIMACPESHTGRALADFLKPRKPNGRITTKTRQKSVKQATHGSHSNGRSRKEIVIHGAAQHNLQKIDVNVPRNKMTVFCGPSGSGKTSLAMDTLYAEGQRRYVESLSAYARQFLGQLPKPKVEHIHGLSPAIAIEQKTVGHTPRSTVGTVTEIYDYLRVLYARLGQMYCPDCGTKVIRQTTDEIVDAVMSLPVGTRLVLLAPLQFVVGQSFQKIWDRVRSQGFLRVRIDGTTYELDDLPQIDHRREYIIEIVVDRISVAEKSRGRIADSIEAALDVGKGVIHIAYCDREVEESDWRVDRLSLDYSCPSCSSRRRFRTFEELTPQHFSFNSPLGWCPACEGLGTERGTNLALLVGKPQRSLMEGAVTAWPDPQQNPLFKNILGALSQQFALPLDVPFNQLEHRHQRVVLFGSGATWITVKDPDAKSNAAATFQIQYKGLYPAIEEASRVSYTYRSQLRELVGETVCSVCQGDRIRDDAAASKLKGRTLPQLCRLPLADVLELLQGTKLNKRKRQIAGDLLHEATSRLSFLVDIGLHYLTLDRPMPTLSGGESQRIRLAGQIGRALTGVLYVLDEPTIGLHPRDNGRLLQSLKRLRDLGNTVVMVEHDREVIEASDRLYDFGPGAGRFGGQVVAAGTPKQIKRKKKVSLTGQYLSGVKEIAIPEHRRISSIKADPVPPNAAWLELAGATINNLQSIDLRIPLGTFTCVTGLSGSGKSSLIEETLAPAVRRKLNLASEQPGPFDSIHGVEHLSKIILVDQQPLGSTPASNPATYTGVFEQIRKLFARMPEARVRGYNPGRFSFNRAGGRCDDCEGLGQKKIEMHFLPDVWVECTTCKGKRFNQETRAVSFKGKSIADVLEMSIGQARELFDSIPKIRAVLETLCAIGLDYLTLGQPAPTLSGGEAQRVKLAAELARPNTGNTLYLLDEPTTGLHFDDIDKLLQVLNSLVDLGNTAVIVEHNLDVIKTADWIIDLGPEAGQDGGRIVAQGTPEDVVEQSQNALAPLNKNGNNGNHTGLLLRSYTGELLLQVLEQGTRGKRVTFDVKQARQKRAGDLKLDQVGKDAKLPWQENGKRWHTQLRIARNGKETRWEGTALEFVTDQLEKLKGFNPINWNDQATVEVTAEKKSGTGWFLHALTGDEWLLRLYFRVPKKTFDADTLQSALDLTPVDDIDELPIYGRGERIRIRNSKGPFQEVMIDVHWLEEIDTPAFREFLQTAARAYLERVDRQKENPEDCLPWKKLGQKWHLMRKGFPSSKRIQWPVSMLEELFSLLEGCWPNAEPVWGQKQKVNYISGKQKENFAEVITKRREGIDLILHAPAGEITMGRITGFGKSREIRHRNNQDQIKIRLTTLTQVRDTKLKSFLTEFQK